MYSDLLGHQYLVPGLNLSKPCRARSAKGKMGNELSERGVPSARGDCESWYSKGSTVVSDLKVRAIGLLDFDLESVEDGVTLRDRWVPAAGTQVAAWHAGNLGTPHHASGNVAWPCGGLRTCGRWLLSLDF
jgi:hypothetical protein